MSRTYQSATDKRADYCYDYENQVWIEGGRYQDCGHPAEMHCTCYGRQHAGETATITDQCR